MKRIEFQMNSADSGKRIDIQASALSGLTRSHVRRLIEKGLLTVNNLKVKANYKTKSGDAICISIPDNVQTLIPENLSIEILYKDDFIIVINKPAGMVVYPGAGHSSGTLMNAIAFYSKKLAAIGSPLRPGVIHRLDKDTSGAIVAAKNGTCP